MDKLSVSYYLPESLVMKIDERGKTSTNRSVQLAEDLKQFYDMMDFGIKKAMKIFSSDELHRIISGIKSRTDNKTPSWNSAKAALIDCVFRMDGNTEEIASKVSRLDNLTSLALFDWSRSN